MGNGIIAPTARNFANEISIGNNGYRTRGYSPTEGYTNNNESFGFIILEENLSW